MFGRDQAHQRLLGLACASLCASACGGSSSGSTLEAPPEERPVLTVERVETVDVEVFDVGPHQVASFRVFPVRWRNTSGKDLFIKGMEVLDTSSPVRFGPENDVAVEEGEFYFAAMRITPT